MRSDEEDDKVKGPPRQDSFQHALKKMEDGVSSYDPNHPSALLAKAVVLKQSPRLKDKAVAQEILQDLINREDTGFHYTSQAIRHLCESLLEEFIAFGEAMVLTEVNRLMARLRLLAQKHQSWHLSVYALVMQARLSMVDGDLTSTLKLLDEAKAIADEIKSVHLLTEVNTERQNVDEQYEKWQRLIQTNAPLKDRLEQAQVLEYLKVAQKIVDRDQPTE